MSLTKQYHICYYTGYGLGIITVGAETAEIAKEDFKKLHEGVTFVAIRELIRDRREYDERY